MLNGPIYPDPMKDFWANAHVHQNELDGCQILSVVYGSHVVINSKIISQAINCEEDGVTVEIYRHNNIFVNLMHIIYGSKGLDESPSTLTPMAKVWYQIMGTNLRPREKGTRWLSSDDKHFILFLVSRTKINLPLSMFNYLKEEILLSREELSFLIPFGRVLSMILVQQGVVTHVQQAGLIDKLVPDWCSAMNCSETIINR